jgi:hypothetical protein
MDESGRGWAQRVVAWGIRRQMEREGAAPGAGHLYWVAEDGQIEDLGAYTPRTLATIAWAHREAYRQARARDVKSRLATVRDEVGRLGAWASRADAQARGSRVEGQ